MSAAALAYLGKTGPDYARFDLLSVISHLILAFLDSLVAAGGAMKFLPPGTDSLTHNHKLTIICNHGRT